MSVLELNPMFLRMNKSLGEIVIYERDGKMFARVKGKKTAPPTAAQMEVNATFSRLSSDWTSAGILMNSSWHKQGDKKKTNGFNLYMKTNFKNEREGKSIELFKPTGEIAPPVFSAAPGASGEIICTYTIPAESAGKHIHFYAKKRNGGLSEGQFKRFSSASEESNTFTLPNLEPGAEYYIYAALTDNEYNEATQVSASVSVIAAAGV